MKLLSSKCEKHTPARASGEDGSALLLAIFVLVLLTGMGVVLLFASRTDVRMSQADVRAKKAFSASPRRGSSRPASSCA